MMKRIMNIKQLRKYSKYFLLAIMVILLVKCFTINTLDQPSIVNAGENFTVKMDVTMDPATALLDINNARLVIGILVPKSWDAKNNTTVTYTGNAGSGTLSLIPADVKAPNFGRSWPDDIAYWVGFGANVIQELEWVVFWSAETYNSTPGGQIYTGEVTITTKAGPQNLKTQLGYYFGASEVDVSSPVDYDIHFANIEVKNGIGETIDYLKPNVTVSPLNSLDNDIITVTFDASIGDTALKSAGVVYLCAKGYTATDDTIEVCEQVAASQMTKISDELWQIDIWPRNLFGLNNDQTLEWFEFSFMDNTGIMVIDVSKKQPFNYTFECN